MKKNSRNKNKRSQTPKPRNEDWMRARLQQSNMELTRPSGNVYKRKPKHSKKGWE